MRVRHEEDQLAVFGSAEPGQDLAQPPGDPLQGLLQVDQLQQAQQRPGEVDQVPESKRTPLKPFVITVEVPGGAAVGLTHRALEEDLQLLLRQDLGQVSEHFRLGRQGGERAGH